MTMITMAMRAAVAQSNDEVHECKNRYELIAMPINPSNLERDTLQNLYCEDFFKFLVS